MRRNKGCESNMRFLFGGVVFYIVLVFTVLIFCFFTFYRFWHDSPDYSQMYRIAFTHEYAGRCYDVYINDSLLYEGRPIDSDSVLAVQRFATDNALLLVDANTQKVTILQLGIPCKVQLGFDSLGDCCIKNREEW